jgi:hypothetical protein
MGGGFCDDAAYQAGKCVVYAPHPNIFQMGGKDKGLLGPHFAEYFLACFAIIVLFTVLIEKAMHLMQHWADEQAHVWRVLGHKVLVELTILGCISFCIFLCNQTFELYKNQQWFVPLEFAHILVFFMACWYCLQSCYFVRSIKLACAAYDKALNQKRGDLEVKLAQSLDAEFTADASQTQSRKLLSASARIRKLAETEVRELLRTSRSQSGGEGGEEGGGGGAGRQAGRRWSGGLLRWCRTHAAYMRKLLWHASDAGQVVDLQILRTVFIQKHQLQPDFDFVSYLAHAMESGVASTLDISHRSWALLLGSFFLAYGACGPRTLGLSPNQNFAVFILCGWVMLVVSCAVLYLSVRARVRTCELGSGKPERECTIRQMALFATTTCMPDHEDVVQAWKVSPSAGMAASSRSSMRPGSGVGGGGGMGSAAAHNPIHGGAAPSHSVTFTGDLPATGTGASRKQPMGRSYTIRDNLTKVRHHWKLHEGNHRNGFRSFPIRRRFLVYALDFLFLGDCMYKSILCCYYFGAQSHSAHGTTGLVLAVLPVALNSLFVTPRVVFAFYMMYGLANIKPAVLSAVVEDMETARGLKIQMMQKLRQHRASERKRGVTRESEDARASRESEGLPPAEDVSTLPDFQWMRRHFQQFAKGSLEHKAEADRQSSCGRCLRAVLGRPPSAPESDADDKIDRTEMYNLLKTLGIILTDFKFGQFMRGIDPNNDGVDFREFLTFLGSISEEEYGMGNTQAGNAAFHQDIALDDLPEEEEEEEEEEAATTTEVVQGGAQGTRQATTL